MRFDGVEMNKLADRISELEKDNKTTIEIIKENDNIYFKEIAELREFEKETKRKIETFT